MREQYHLHLQVEVEGMLRYVSQTGKEQAKKRLEYQNAESILHTHESNLHRKTKDNKQLSGHNFL